MSKVKHLIEIEEPEFLNPNGDGTVARELMDEKPFLCRRCNGSGYVMTEQPRKRELVKEQCDVCLGYGELRAVVLVEWKPYIRK